jgi:hypothetical protein
MEKNKKKKYSADSVDNVIDRFFIDYEKTSMISKNESFDIKKFIFSELLIEADEEEKKGKKAGKKETKKLDYKLDTIEFAEKLVRLVENYDNLINMRDLILARAINYIQENHNKETAIRLERDLREQFDIEINRSNIDKEYDYKQPYAMRSGGGAT